MSDIKPVPEIHPANRFIKSSLSGRFSFDSYAAATSPKIRELRARHEALHATEKDQNLLLVFSRC